MSQNDFSVPDGVWSSSWLRWFSWYITKKLNLAGEEQCWSWSGAPALRGGALCSKTSWNLMSSQVHV